MLSLTAQLVRVADASLKDAQVVAKNARRSLVRMGDDASGRAQALVAEIWSAPWMSFRRSSTRPTCGSEGTMPPGSTRVVSLHDTDARPIAKGRIGRPVEFGYKAQLVDNSDGIVLDHSVVIGNPPDAPMLVPSIRRASALFGRIPRAVTADRGYGKRNRR